MTVSLDIPIFRNQVLKITCFQDDLKYGEWEQMPQFHNNCEIGFFVSGNISTVIEDTVYFLQNSDILTIAPNEMHMGKILKDCAFQYFQFDIPNELSHFCGEENGFLSCFFDRNIGEKNLIHPSPSVTEIIFKNLYTIRALIDSDVIDKKALCFSYFIQTISLVNESFHSPVLEVSNKMKEAPDILKKVIRIINNEYKTLYDLNDIATKSNISKSYLTKLFKQYIGFSPYQFLLYKKIACSKLLLKNGANVTEACYQSGFNDYSYFISLFKKAEGLTPLQYKKKYLL